MLTWIERKLAATLFATPPSSTVEDALRSFLEAEEKEPGFYKANRVYISKVSCQCKSALCTTSQSRL